MRNKPNKKAMIKNLTKMIVVAFALLFLLANFNFILAAFSGSGDGSLANKYIVTNCSQLQEMKDYPRANYSIANNINMSDCSNTQTGSGFIPIGNATSGWEFIGKVFGNGNNISNLFINRPTEDYVGLFGKAYVSSSVFGRFYDIGLDNVNISGKDDVGGLVGYGSAALINNSHASGNVSGRDYVGGLVGVMFTGGIVDNSHANGKVSGRNAIGGLVGIGTNGAVINNSYATGNVTGVNYLGGLIGDARNGIVDNSYASGNVSGSNYVAGLIGYGGLNIHNSSARGNVKGGSFVGGLVGRGYDGSGIIIDNSYSTGNLTGTNYMGGLVGLQFLGTISINNSYSIGSVTVEQSRSGGLVGYCYGNIDIDNSYSTGKIKGASYMGGLVGYDYGGNIDIDNSYSTGNVESQNVAGGLIGFGYGYGKTILIDNSYTTGNITSSTGNNAGGLVGYGYFMTINNSYSTGNVSGTGSNVGGLVGYTSGTVIDNSYWNNYSGTLGCYGVGSLTYINCTAIQNNLSYFYNTTNPPMNKWNFTSIWRSITNSFPILRWQTPPAPTISGIVYSPSSAADIDPYANITFNASVSSSVGVSAVLLRIYNGTGWKNYTMQNLTAAGYNATIAMESAELNYTFNVWANDTLGNSDSSVNQTFQSWYEKTWTASLSFDSGVAGKFSQVKNIGNLTINNTGDSNLTFSSIIDNSPYGSYGLTFDGEDSIGIFVISSTSSVKGSRVFSVNGTFGSTARDDNVTITIIASTSGASPVNTTKSFILSTYPGGAFFSSAIDVYPASYIVNQSSNFSLGAYIRNLGDDYAYNISVNWTLPSGFNITSGNTSMFLQNLSGKEISSDYENRSDININISSTIHTGSYIIYFSSLGNNGTGITEQTNISTNITLNVYCNSGDGVCGSGCSYTSTDTFYDPDCPVPAAAVSASSSGGSGGGESEGDEGAVIKSEANYEFVRGEKQEFILPLKNKYPYEMKNIKISVSGINAEYAEIFPDSISSIEAGGAKDIIVKINTPSYLTEGSYQLIFTIDYILAMNNSVVSNAQEKRYITLNVLDISKERAIEIINATSDYISEMNKSGMKIEEISNLYLQILEAYNKFKLADVKELGGEAETLYKNAFDSKKLIEQLNTAIAEKEREGINVDGTKKLLFVAETAFKRGEYALAVEKLQNAQNQFAYETKGEFNLIRTIQNNPLQSGGIIIAFAFISYGTSLAVRRSLYKRKMRLLGEEEKLLLGLMKVVQKECFEGNKMSMEEYGQAMTQYESQLSKVISERIKTETKLTSMLKLRGGKKKALLEEKKKLIELMQDLQNRYLNKGNVETRVYENMIKTYSARLTEVEEELTFMDARENIKRGKTIK